MTDALASKISDHLNPVVVKDLRQGLRSNLFVTSFLSLHAFMLLALLLLGAVSTGDRGTGFFQGVFWFFFVTTIVIIFPLRAISSLSDEIRFNTLELLHLTRLNALRILMGKWLSLTSQSGLLLMSVLPYLVLRYFLGGVDLYAELLNVLILFIYSLLLTAFFLALSAFGSTLLSILAGLGAVFFTAVPLAVTILESSPPPLPRLQILACILVFGPVCFCLFLLWAASRIAPPSVNLSVWKRLMVFPAGLAAVVCWMLGIPWELALAAFFVVCGLICFNALSEDSRPLLCLYRPFARRGLPGLLAGRLFYPGWPSAVNFTVLLGILAALGLSAMDQLTAPVLLSLVSSLNVLLMPLAWLKLFRRDKDNTLAGYMAVHIVLACFTLVTAIIMSVGFANRGNQSLLLFMPLIGISAVDLHGPSLATAIQQATISGFCLLAGMLVLLALERRPLMRETRRLEKASLEGRQGALLPETSREDA